uniref:Haloacid dehalogenase-like hydrolase n=1 Tax=Siphoviridae sp. ctKy93 TaxID=2827569 RepID=A0A8S5RRC0_9CAUD|nr:MAG TPA: haloacid dehalogenase-like hydrolase [Siphoviridae sp. ctKy93]
MIIAVDFDNTLLNSLQNLGHTSPPTWGRGLKYVNDIKTLKAIVRQAELDNKYHS